MKTPMEELIEMLEDRNPMNKIYNFKEYLDKEKKVIINANKAGMSFTSPPYLHQVDAEQYYELKFKK